MWKSLSFLRIQPRCSGSGERLRQPGHAAVWGPAVPAWPLALPSVPVPPSLRGLAGGEGAAGGTWQVRAETLQFRVDATPALRDRRGSDRRVMGSGRGWSTLVLWEVPAAGDGRKWALSPFRPQAVSGSVTPQPGPAVASALCHRRPLLSLGSNPNLPPCPLCPDLSSRAGPPSAAPELYFKPVPPSPALRDNEQQLGRLARHSTSPGATPGRGFSLFVRMGMCPNLPPLQGRCQCQPEREHGDTQGNVGICVGTWGHVEGHGDMCGDRGTGGSEHMYGDTGT